MPNKLLDWSIQRELKLVSEKTVLPCPNCGSGRIWKVHIWSARLPWWWHMECSSCHWCSKTKLFLTRAIRYWNKHNKGDT